ncbi:sensor of ECF-type sigma factor [Xanthomarina sp. GH4-25]|uniref:sensor of ECF-type sigma factor n=1 Tax=Xanthomarina sp. GH4-25 TaxID=3349335 RepID=UPI000D6834DA|nr:sensor of ECF-type sigma factor [Flavobacteriaceae bacterium LYZ1037]
MKKNILITLLILLSLTGFAQDKHEKIKALKTAYITEQLNLSKTEAEKFWPIYNKYEEEKSAIKSESHKDRKDIDYNKLTEVEANAMLVEMKALNNRRYKIYNNLITDLQQVISSKKIVQLKKAEMDFNRKMFDEYRKRHHPEHKEKP